MARRKYKTPLAVRKKQALARKKFKVPVLTTAALAVPIMDAFDAGNGVVHSLSTKEGFSEFSNTLVANFTGFAPKQRVFSSKRLFVGLGPLLAVWLVKKTGVFKSVNQSLARSRVPIRLS